jgi:hypothetical protein
MSEEDDKQFFKELFSRPDGKCPECGHKEEDHGMDDDGQIYCNANNWHCNCGNNIGR